MRIWHKDKDISNLVSALTWSGSRLQAARKLEFDYVQDDRDANIPQIVINNGETVFGYDDAGALVFRGNVFDVEKDRKRGNVHIVAFDNLFILTKSRTTRKFTNVTPEAVAAAICTELGIKPGNFAAANTPVTFIADNKTGYEIIMMAYTEAAKTTKQKYFPIMAGEQGDQLDIILKGSLIDGYIADANANMAESVYRESIENMVNRILVTDEQGNSLNYVVNQEWIDKYSMIQAVYKTDPNKNTQEGANAMLQGPERSGYITVLGDYRVKASYSIQVRDSLFNGQFWVKADTHTFIDGKHEMKLELEFENLMDEVEPDTQKKGQTADGTMNVSAGMDAGWDAWGNTTMDTGDNGCVEAVGKIGGYYSPFLAQESNNGVVNVPQMVADAETAGIGVQDFSSGSLEKGDIIVYGDNQHVVIYDGNGGYYGNSSSQHRTVHGSDYTAMDYAPTKIIKTSRG